MKKILFLILISLPIYLFAQSNDKYLAGAVPITEGKVLFTSEMTTTGMSKSQIHQTILNWAQKRYQPQEGLNARVLYQNQEDGSIAVNGDEYIVFKSSAFSLDRTRINYQLQIYCENDKSKIELTRIRYLYNENRNGGEKYIAEEWITDEFALNKSKTKLYPITGKFRKGTIDLKDEIFNEIRTSLGNQMIALGIKSAPTTPESQVAVIIPANTEQTQTVASNKIHTDTINSTTFIEQVDRITITAGNNEQIEINKECWGGFGDFFGKRVAFCLIDIQKTICNMLLSQNDNYEISFYKQNSSQPSKVIKCKKMIQQNIIGKEAKKMNPSCSLEKSYNLYVGEIIK